MSDDLLKFEADAKKRAPSAAAELVHYLRDNKKWFLVPIVIVVLLLGTIIVLGGSGAAPFIYALF